MTTTESERNSVPTSQPAPDARHFPDPYEITTPEGAEGWEELYPYYLRFREDRRDFEEGRFWFADLQHWPTVFKPFDTITVEFAIKCLGQYNTRHLLIPPANGIDYRVHNGYVYMSPVPVAAYLFSGVYALFVAGAAHGWIDRRAAITESVLGIRRAGANMVLTYWASELAGWLKES